jgi:hypothetical protein
MKRSKYASLGWNWKLFCWSWASGTGEFLTESNLLLSSANRQICNEGEDDAVLLWELEREG